MKTIRAVLYLKTGIGAKPYRTIYFTEEEYERLMDDYESYKRTGEPECEEYFEEVSADADQSVLIEFSAIAEIKTAVKE